MKEPLRFSILRQVGRSPAHAKYAMDHEPGDTPAMRLGRLCHALSLGTTPAIVWDGTRRGKAWEAFRDEHAGQDIVTADEMDTGRAMSDALLCHPEARGLISGVCEETILFDFAGRACRATPDVYVPGNFVTEVKSTFDASPLRFPYHAIRMGYHAQLAWQKDALISKGLAGPDQRLFIVAVESKPPHAVAVFEVTSRAEDFGRRTYRTWLEQFLVCERSNEWPGYPLGVLDAPEEGLALEIGGEEVEVA